MRIKARTALSVSAALALGATLAACGGRERKTFVDYDRYLRESSHGEEDRRIAQEQPLPACLKDRLRGDGLTREIQRLESRRKPLPIGRATVYDTLDLAKLPPLQANYLDRFSDAVEAATAKAAAPECQRDLFCLLDQVYRTAYASPVPADGWGKWNPTPDGDEGKLIYLWYLRMNGAVNASGETPGYNLGNKVLARILFSAEQLRVLDETLYRASSQYQNVFTVRTVNRMPEGYPYPKSEGIANAYSGVFSINLGDGKSTPKQGYVRFFPDGVRMDLVEQDTYRKRKTRVSMRETALHELSHAVDYTLDNPGKDLQPFSLSTLWLELSGWKLVSAIGADGTVDYEWRNDPSREKFTRWYGQTSPLEDFADTASYFIHDPVLLSDMPKKRAMISGMLYGGRTYEPDALKAYYRSEFERRLARLFPDQLKECLPIVDPGQIQRASKHFVTYATWKGRFSRETPINQCLYERWNRDFGDVLADFRANDFPACDTLTEAEAGIEAGQTMEAWLKHLDVLLKSEDKQLTYSTQVRNAFDSAAENLDIRELYLACRYESDPEACFEERKQRGIQAWVASADPALQSLFQNLVPVLFRDASFENARMQAIVSMGQMLEGALPAAWMDSWKLFGACKDQRADAQGTLLLSPYDGGSQYVRPSILNCINSMLPDSARATLVRYAQEKKFGWGSDNGLRFATERAYRKYFQGFEQWIGDAAGKEQALWEALRVKAFAAQARLPAGCVEDAEKKFSDWFDAYPAGANKPREDYAPKAAVVHGWAVTFCKST